MLSTYLRLKKEDREVIASDFRDDPRNSQSVSALASLVGYVERIENEGPEGEHWRLVERLQPHLYGDGYGLGGERATREVYRYGFGYPVRGESQHEQFLSDLWIACMEDAYDDAKEFSGSLSESNWTGELLLCEIHAAWSLVRLPENYWRRRERTFEADLEAELRPLIAAADDE